MNELSKSSQEANQPQTKFDKLFILIESLPVIASVVSANLNHALSVYEATRDSESDDETLEAILSLTSQHLLTLEDLLDSAGYIYNFADFQVCKKLSKNIRLTALSTTNCTLTYPGKADFIHGFYLSSERLVELVHALSSLVKQNEGRING